jgi:hypothetical protein
LRQSTTSIRSERVASERPKPIGVKVVRLSDVSTPAFTQTAGTGSSSRHESGTSHAGEPCRDGIYRGQWTSIDYTTH